MPEVSPIARRKEVGALLRQYRQELDLTVAEVAGRLDMSQAKLSRLERGERGLQINDVRVLAGLYKLPDHEADHLVALARASRERGWWADYSELDEAAPIFYGLEQDALTHRNYEALRVPGLLQAESYATALISRFRPGRTIDTDLVEERVAARVRRQAILDSTAREFRFIVDESVLVRAIGSPAVMAEQLDRLIDVASKPNVTLQVLPFSAGEHPGMSGSFILMSFAADMLPDTVFLEGLVRSWFIDDESQTELYQRVFEALEEQAEPPSSSLDMIDRQRGEWLRLAT